VSCESILKLEGLGKEAWEEIDPRQYVNELRDEWSYFMENTALDKAQAIIGKFRGYMGFDGWWLGQHPDFHEKVVNEMAGIIEGTPAEGASAQSDATEDMTEVVDAAAKEGDAA
jgi:hypothetical protein